MTVMQNVINEANIGTTRSLPCVQVSSIRLASYRYMDKDSRKDVDKGRVSDDAIGKIRYRTSRGEMARVGRPFHFSNLHSLVIRCILWIRWFTLQRLSRLDKEHSTLTNSSLLEQKRVWSIFSIEYDVLRLNPFRRPSPFRSHGALGVRPPTEV
jgi:hypothetical protein